MGFPKVVYGPTTHENLWGKKNHARGARFSEPSTRVEVSSVINKLHKGKAAGYDGLTAEHIVYSGEPMFDVLVTLLSIRGCSGTRVCS